MIERKKDMSENSNEVIVTGKFQYQQDSKRFHRFQILTGSAGIVGTVYIPRDKKSMPKRLVLEYEAKAE